ncbi:MAG: hypothetical protein HC892_00410 [Saprospiraceae bacterium]|nr:hypothetical protein [Saprospiraceae bacterium]
MITLDNKMLSISGEGEIPLSVMKWFLSWHGTWVIRDRKICWVYGLSAKDGVIVKPLDEKPDHPGYAVSHEELVAFPMQYCVWSVQTTGDADDDILESSNRFFKASPRDYTDGKVYVFRKTALVALRQFGHDTTKGYSVSTGFGVVGEGLSLEKADHLAYHLMSNTAIADTIRIADGETTVLEIATTAGMEWRGEKLRNYVFNINRSANGEGYSHDE